ncbi:flagellar filament capping protein FliD [Tepidibacter sp. Z1-5]|uniref:flagellar filament capping protein FliD n=1 Tax=Tepidibacter sp. Z1-5 TaxID=3134138 RepID=UPI0030C52D50
MSGIRFSGMASGMDTESIVKQLMDVERLKLNKYNEQKQIKEWTQEAYNDVNKDIANFMLDTKKELGVGFGGSIGSASWIKEAISSNTDAIDVSANSSAVSGSHSLEVVHLAKGVNGASSEAIKDKNGEVITSDDTLENLFGISGDYKVKINNVELTFSKDDKLSDIANEINEKVSDVKASFDITAKRFFISNTGTGTSTGLKIENIDNNPQNLFKDKLRLNVTNGAGITEELTYGKNYIGQDAEINFDGANNITYSSNNFTINGISITAKAEETTTIKVDTDVDGVYDKIKGFVDKYNELIDKLDKKIGEKRYRDYQPLTSEQKETMDEKTIELWEKKAKSGLLKGDEHINRMLAATRSGLYEEVYSDVSKGDLGKLSKFSFISEIGITTGNYKDKGKLQIDEKELKDAIRKDADGVMDLLFSTSNVTESDINNATTLDEKSKLEAERRAETGLINRLYDDMVDGMKNIIDKSGTGDNASLYRNVKSNILIDFVTKKGSISLLHKDVVNIEKQIVRENSRLANVEDRYWKQFTAMEKAMNKMNSQSSWLASQMGGM